jgi:hypothetical protein
MRSDAPTKGRGIPAFFVKAPRAKAQGFAAVALRSFSRPKVRGMRTKAGEGVCDRENSYGLR